MASRKDRKRGFRELLAVRPGSTVDLATFDAGATFGRAKEDAETDLANVLARLADLQGRLWAEAKHPVLVVVQGIDAAGKDGTIRVIAGAFNPQGTPVTSFKVPSPVELAHDYLWRVHAHVPGKGEIGIFNRSHYEDVLAARVLKLVPVERWQSRYRAINEFERELTQEGTLLLKFFLHISEEEQRDRIRARLEDPTKHWKFSANDLADRPHWAEYMAAIGEMLTKTSTSWAPWYLIPSDKKWFRNWAVSKILVDALESLDLTWPPLHPDVARKYGVRGTARGR